jgi:hypothetical protein
MVVKFLDMLSQSELIEWRNLRDRLLAKLMNDC